MFSDIFGSLIGFISIILLLSLIVTSMVQFTQSSLRLRARNLQQGLSVLLNDVRKDPAVDYSKPNSALALQTSNETIPKAKRTKEDIPVSFFARLIGPTVSWVDIKQLPNTLKASGIGLDDDQINEITTRFSSMERYLSKRFMEQMRWVSFAWALLIAVWFQVSTTELLRDLSTNPELRSQYVALAEGTLERASEALKTIDSYQGISDQALNKLTANHPDLQAVLEEASGIGANKTDLEKELRDILADNKDAEKLITEYGDLLDELYVKKRDAALKTAQSVVGQLSAYNIELWANGKAYYIKNGKPVISHWVGVLITTILLTLGAPFWFEQLKTVTGLRDALQTNKKTGKKEGKS